MRATVKVAPTKVGMSSIFVGETFTVALICTNYLQKVKTQTMLCYSYFLRTFARKPF